MNNAFAFNEVSQETIECRECGHKAHSLIGHLDSEHGLSPDQYQTKHSGAPLLSVLGQAVFEQEMGVSPTGPTNIEQVDVDSIDAFNVGFGKNGDMRKSVIGYKGFDKKADNIPDVDPHYVFQSDVTRNFLLGMIKGGKIYLLGPTGSGKTTLPEQYAARTGRPYFRQQFHQEMEPSELLGTWTVTEGGEMAYLYSGLALAIQKPSVVVLDEYDSGNPAVTAIINGLLDGYPLVLANKGGEMIKVHKDCLLVATGNTNGMGDDTGLYTSTTVQSFATMNRFKMFLPIDYMSADDEVGLLRSIFPKMPENEARDMVKVANLVREGFKGGKISAVLSTRQLINWGEWFYMTADPERAFNLAFAHQLGVTDNGVVMQLFQRVFGK